MEHDVATHSSHLLELILLVIFAGVIIFSMFTNAIGKTILTLPIVFVGFGLMGSGFTEQLGMAEELRTPARLLAEITLILVLFADASHVKLSRLRTDFAIPLRMLIIGMPLTIMLGTFVVYFISPTSGFAMALLTAAVLTPTDAALGQTVVSSPDVPPHLSQTINVESGLNDGLALPFVLLGAILASQAMEHGGGTEGLAMQAIIQVILGPLIGIAIGWGVAKCLDYARDRDWIIESAQGIVFLSTAFLSYLTAELLGGNGFICAFIAGAAFGNTYKHDLHFVSEFMEGAGQILTMAAFLVFGALMLPAGIAHATLPTFLIAVAFLTVVRMGPIWLSLLGTGLNNPEKLFLGWFGPRGIASVLFTLIMMEEYDFPNEEELLACVSMTVGMSVLLHGISALPFSKRIGKYASR